ncbi:MAG: hypothetical protein LH606_09860 [Cytophagaceae bacterium]|nr:hypothetical protein [Cytophagaceae bacterium]
MKKITPLLFLTLLGTLALTSCKKVDDPLVPREQSPVLVYIEDAPYQSGFSGEPTVLYSLSTPVTLRARILELDKTNLLDYKKGIDSIPVPNLKIAVMLRNGTSLGDATTDAKGRITLTKTWAELGVSAVKAGSSVSLSWTGTYKDITFTRLSKVQAR